MIIKQHQKDTIDIYVVSFVKKQSITKTNCFVCMDMKL